MVNSIASKLISREKKNTFYEKTVFKALKLTSKPWYKRRTKAELKRKRNDIIKRYLERCDSLVKKASFVMSVIAKPLKNIAVFGVVVFSAVTIYSTATYDVVLGVYVGDELVGYLDSKSVMTNAINAVQSDMESVSDCNYTLDMNVDYVFVNVKNPVLLNDADCYRIAYNIASKDFVDAYALYVDGQFIAACTDYDSLSEILNKATGEDGTEGNSGFVKNDMKHYYQKCLKSTVVPPDKIAELLNIEFAAKNDITVTVDSDTMVQAYSNVLAENGDNHDDFDGVGIPRFATEGSVLSIPNKLSDGTKITTDRSELQVELDLVYEKYETKIETIGYETTYINSDDYYEGTQMLKTGGREGSAEVEYRIEYDKDGEISREVVSKKIIKEPITEVMVIGTSPAPTANSTGNLIWPTNTDRGISSDYGGRSLFGSYDFHLGIDIINGYANDIWAADSGVVTFAGYHNSYGYYVTIEHANGMVTRYAHMSKIYTEKGAQVKQGDVIGAIGKTGVATAYHLHFEVIIDGKTVDPLNYLPEL